MDSVKIALYAGPIALAAFAGVFLGGIALSFFWKNFGPWQLLEACKQECSACHEARLRDANSRADKDAEIADIRAQLSMLQSVIEKSGFRMLLAPHPHPNPNQNYGH